MQSRVIPSQTPLEQSGAYLSKFKTVSITSNNFDALLEEDLSKVYIYDLHISPDVEEDNDEELHSIWEGVKEKIAKKIWQPVWMKRWIFSLMQCSVPFVVTTVIYTVTVTVCKREVQNLKDNQVLL